MSRVCAGLVVVGLWAALVPEARAQGIVPGGWSGEVSYQSFGFAAPGGMAGPSVASGWATPGFGAPAFGSLPVAPTFGSFAADGAVGRPAVARPMPSFDGTGGLIHAVRRTTARRRRS
jgi:hypothetical protein